MVCLLAEPQENPLILWGSWLLRALLVLISAVKSPPFPEARLHHPSQLAQCLRDHIFLYQAPEQPESLSGSCGFWGPVSL